MTKKQQPTLNGEVIDMKKWMNPKSKIRKVSKIEEDGSKTIAHVVEWNGIGKFHNMEGPALINKEQHRKEYYLNGLNDPEQRRILGKGSGNNFEPYPVKDHLGTILGDKMGTGTQSLLYKVNGIPSTNKIAEE